MLTPADNKILEKWRGWHAKSPTVFTPSYDGRGAGFAPAFGAFNNATFDVGQVWKTSAGTKRTILGIVGDTFLFESGGKIYEQNRSSFQNDTSKIDTIGVNTYGMGVAMEIMVTSAIVVVMCAPAVLASLPAAAITEGSLTITSAYSFDLWVVTAIPAIVKTEKIVEAALRARALMKRTTPTLYEVLIHHAIFGGVKTIPAEFVKEVKGAFDYSDKSWLEIAGLPEIPEIKDNMTWDEYISTTKDCVDTTKDYYELASAIYSTWIAGGGGVLKLVKVVGGKLLEGLLEPLKEWKKTIKEGAIDAAKGGAKNAFIGSATGAVQSGSGFAPLSVDELSVIFLDAGIKDYNPRDMAKIATELSNPKAAAAVCAALTCIMDAAGIDPGKAKAAAKATPPGHWSSRVVSKPVKGKGR